MIVINTKHKPNFKGVQLPPVSKKEFDRCLSIWQNNTKVQAHLQILKTVFGALSTTNTFVAMYGKLELVDLYYSTNLQKHHNIADIANYLVKNPNINSAITNGDISAVKAIQSYKSPTDNFQVFASKYCHTINPYDFPIYDNIVKDVLEYYINQNPTLYENAAKKVEQDYINKGKIWKPINWHKITSNDWLDYEKYVQIVDTFIMAHKFITDYAQAHNMPPYVVFDAYLWTLGKQIETGVNLIKSIRKAANSNNTNALDKLRQKLNINKPDATVQELEDAVENIYF